MLKNRILSTLKFFDLQDYPLTLLELDRFLVADLESLKNSFDGSGELRSVNVQPSSQVQMGQILHTIEDECLNEVENQTGFYCLKGRGEIISARLDNYFYGIKREKLIRRYAKFLKYIPFVRGAALAGSQAMGQEKKNSDIDLLVIVDNNFLWLVRTLVTGYFHLTGKRRHGLNIANRFCLNHYLAGPKEINQLRNFYTAAEYLKLRPLAYEHVIWAFTENNKWLRILFPNARHNEVPKDKQNPIQKFLENILDNNFGRFAERVLKNRQLPKIRREKFIVVEDDELSFHPDSKQEALLENFLM